MRFKTNFRSYLAAPALAALLWFAAPASAAVSVGISINIAPPVLPVYTQPPCPTPGYMWTPGYWAWGAAGYYWVPGVWIAPPRPGLLWTPGYWALGGGVYGWHAGYWGPHVGFYGGVNYGFGYGGAGFVGGRWFGGAFHYNTAVTNVNTTVIRNTYVDRTVVHNTTIVNNRTSFNGPGGIGARPTPQQQTAMREQHFQATQSQVMHEQGAGRDRTLLASNNHGRPPVPAVGTVNDRRYNQQERIGQGVKSGQLTPGEAGRAEGQQQRINQQVGAERRANGGQLSQGERRQVNREQNHANREIHNEKHNEREAPR